MKNKKMILAVSATLLLGLSACTAKDSGNTTASETGTEETIDTIQGTITDDSEVSEYMQSILDDERVIENQVFEVTLEGWGDVIFAAYEPETSESDVEYRILEEGKEPYVLSGWSEDNTRLGESFVQVLAVAFKDYNDDGRTDIIVIGEYEDSEEIFPEARVYLQSTEEKSFATDNLLCEWLQKQHYNDSIATIMSVKDEYADYVASMDGSRSTYEQQKIIAESSEMWLEYMDYANEVERYAVTDLDGNGRLEIIVSSMGGTGAYTYSRFFEVNETYDGLVELTTDFVEGDSQPDIIEESPVTVYRDSKGVIHYIVYDYLRAVNEYYYMCYDLTLENGQITHKLLARNSEIYNEDGIGTFVYEDANGQEITEEEYLAMPETVFADAEKADQVTFDWRDTKELADLSAEEIQKKLGESYNTWTWLGEQ